MESQEILNKQELKHQHKLSCLNKGDETRVSRGCYSILCDEVDIQSCNYDRQAILGGRCSTRGLHNMVLHYSLQPNKGKASPKPMVNMKKALKLEGQPNLRTSLLSRKGVLLMQMHLHWSFSCVGFCCAEAATFGVLPTTANSLYRATASSQKARNSYKSCGNQEHLRSSAP